MRILAYIDQSPFAASVCSHAVWASRQLNIPIELVHAIDLPASIEYRDFSGYFAVDAPDAVLQERVQLDAMQNRVLMEEGRRLLDTAIASIKSAGIDQVSARLFQGTIAEHLQQHRDEVVLVVAGIRGEGAERDPGHLGRNVERLVRSAHRPVLIAAKEFTPVEHTVFAWDGGRSSEQALSFLTTNALLAGIATTVLHVSESHGSGDSKIGDAQAKLQAAGVPAEVDESTGPVAETILRVSRELPAQLVVMGAFGHSRIRRLIVGSATTEVLMRSRCSVLVFH